ncbi:MAG: hypothetical protein QM572_14860, partial [Nocardioides sp.]|uniref:hypothetical protein n=1 Tax=Nocardioides sp. TaxID=35761 RepID=UPI0039E60559
GALGGVLRAGTPGHAASLALVLIAAVALAMAGGVLTLMPRAREPHEAPGNAPREANGHRDTPPLG